MPAGPDEVPFDFNGGEVSDTDRHHGQNTDGDSKLCQNGSLDRRPLGNRIGLLHELEGKTHDC